MGGQCEWRPCPCGKRNFGTERNAEKAMGRAQAKRTRRADAAGTRRGMHVERRSYICDYGGIHLTSENASAFDNRVGGLK